MDTVLSAEIIVVNPINMLPAPHGGHCLVDIMVILMPEKGS